MLHEGEHSIHHSSGPAQQPCFETYHKWNQNDHTKALELGDGYIRQDSIWFSTRLYEQTENQSFDNQWNFDWNHKKDADIK